MSYDMPKILSITFHSYSIQIEDFKMLTLLILLTLLAPRRGVKLENLLLGMSYDMPKVFSSEFQSNSIKIADFKINPINPFNPISTKGGSKIFKPITRNVLQYVQNVKFQISES